LKRKAKYSRQQPITVAPVSVEKAGGEIRETGWRIANVLITQWYPKASGVTS